MGDDDTAESCDHDWTLVNRDENRLIYKCPKCGELRRD
jgi:predicted RNA-binding Zn-ribbon protein involved in translation (DUF1610 family)